MSSGGSIVSVVFVVVVDVDVFMNINLTNVVIILSVDNLKLVFCCLTVCFDD